MSLNAAILNKHMIREEAIKIISDKLSGRQPLIVSTGLMSRELYGYRDCESNFYMVGSMGLASAIGLGLALNIGRDRKIFVLDGDASLLMGLNNICNIALHQPLGLVHLVLDNNAYASCSEEKTASHLVKIDQIAAGAGYNKILTVSSQDELNDSLEQAIKLNGPIFILIRIDLGGRRDLPRPLNLPDMAENFKKFIARKYEQNDTK